MEKIRNNKVFKIVYGIIKFTFIFLVALYLLFILVQRVTDNSSIMGYRIFTVASESMIPVYEINDVILVKEYEVEDLKVGDDIAYIGKFYEMKDKIVTHRIIRIEQDEELEIYTKGLANPAEDPAITEDQVLGRVIYKFTIISLVTKLVRNKVGFFFLIFIPLVLVLFLEIADTILDIKLEKLEAMEEEEKENGKRE